MTDTVSCYLHVGSRQSFVHVPLPDAWQVQFFVHPVSVQLPLPEQSMLHPLPAHDRFAEPEESAVTVHPP